MKKLLEKMKKVSTLRLAFVLFIALEVSFSVVSAVFARYQSSEIYTGVTPASVWDFDVKVNGYQTTDLAKEVDLIEGSGSVSNLDENSYVGSGIAVGSAGYMPVELDGTDTQVSSLVTVTATFLNLPSGFRFTDNLGRSITKTTGISGFVPTDSSAAANYNQGSNTYTGTATSISYSYYFSYEEIARWNAAYVTNHTITDPYIDLGFRWSWVNDSEDYAKSGIYAEVQVSCEQVMNLVEVPTSATSVRFVTSSDDFIKNDDNTLNIAVNDLGTAVAIDNLTNNFYLDVNGLATGDDTYTLTVAADSTYDVVLGTFRREDGYSDDKATATINVSGDYTAADCAISDDFTYEYNNVKAYNFMAEKLVGDLNKTLLAQTKKDTAYDAVSAVYAALTSTDKTKYSINDVDDLAQGIASTGGDNDLVLWDTVSGLFVYVKDGTYQQLACTYLVTSVGDDCTLFRFYNEMPSTQTYSIYLAGEVTGTIDNLTTGLDVGSNTGITAITYDRSSATTAQSVIIRTNTFGTQLTINGATGDTVSHYGFAGLVNIIKVAMSSYDEYGVVGRVSATSSGAVGHIDVKAGATVYQIEQLGGDATKVSVDENATVYDINHEQVEGSIVETTEKFTETITVTHTEDERITAVECLHTSTEIVVDGYHVYEVCKTCGYTVIHVGNSIKTVAMTNDADAEIAIIPKAVYGANQITNSDKDTSGGQIILSEIVGQDKNNVDATGFDVIPSVEPTPTVEEQTIDMSCQHNFSLSSTTATCTAKGVSVYTCSKCNLEYEVNSAALGHNYVDGTCSRCGLSATLISNATELSAFCSTGTETYGLIANDFDVSGTVFCTRESDFTIDFNGHTVSFNAEYSSTDATKKGAFSIETGYTMTLLDSSYLKTGKFMNTATTTSGKVFLVGVYCIANSSVTISGLNVELTSTSSTKGQIYGLVRSDSAADAIIIQDSDIILSASTGKTVGALVEGKYLKTLTIDNVNVDSTGSGIMVRLNDGAVTNITNSKFNIENTSDAIIGLDITGCGANSKIENVRINCSAPTVTSAISANTNATIKDCTISVEATTGLTYGIKIGSSTNGGLIIDNNEITVTTSSTSSTAKASGIYIQGDNHIIKNCTIVATNTGVSENAYAIEKNNTSSLNNVVKDSYCTGNIKGINVESGYFSVDIKDWTTAGYTSTQEGEWYTIKTATNEEIICELTYTENSQQVTKQFVSLVSAFNKIEALNQKDDKLLTIIKDCSSTITSCLYYCDLTINKDVNVTFSSLQHRSDLDDALSCVRITNNGNLQITNNINAEAIKSKAVVVNNGTLNCLQFNVTANVSFINNGSATVKTLTVAGGKADGNGVKTADSGTVTNNGTITVLANGKLTMSALTSYALNSTTDEVKETLYPVFNNEGTIVGTDATSTMTLNRAISGSNSLATGNYTWNSSEQNWTTEE